MEENKICLHCYVSGKVQGVWYRSSTVEQATELGLTGWVRNLPDGRVEVLVCGPKKQVLKLYEWMQRGPELARVSDVSSEEISWKDYGSFMQK